MVRTRKSGGRMLFRAEEVDKSVKMLPPSTVLRAIEIPNVALTRRRVRGSIFLCI